MYRRGIVTELDPEKVRARVEFQDRDGVKSWWLEVNQPAATSGKNRVYSMPDMGAQVNCLVDEKAEAGTIIGSIYSDLDPPPITDGRHMHAALEGGLVFDYDRGTGKLTLSAPGGIELKAGASTIEIKPGETIIATPSLKGQKT
ncbi:phage baseplate assembly protein V [Ancylobacter sp. 3268]|uniref:phage baseplate assembly protein V n=1 Tax=Ancylobacter sp. 3268 TaxID=2817752 RepID=UPI0028573DA9|nr:phage baseplate assembly protein V [Ancylobacter sp. 3268]MDR6952686.1 phage baseplate assembly protein V [Ancylobacter sp. 3268]